MGNEAVQDRLRLALGRIRTAAGEPDLVASGRVGRVEVDEAGAATIELMLRPGDAVDLAETVRLVASGVPGVTGVRVRLRQDREESPEAAPPEGTVPAEEAPASRERPGRRPLPVVGAGAGSRAAGAGARQPRSGALGGGAVSRAEASRHPREAEPLAGVQRIVAVSSGKGGVGKSTISTNLAAALAGEGLRVGLLDADIYGPDIPTMFGVYEKPRMREDRVVPLEAHGVKLMSLGLLVDEDTPAIWRGPIIMGIVRQFLHQVEWGELDYLIVDLPPGTGDAQLSLVQLVRVDGAVMVTTPQDVSVTGVLKGIRMFESVEVPILGVVENMRGFICPSCEQTHEIFGAGGGEKLAASLGVPFLGAVPLGLAVREEGDRGIPTVIGRPDSPEGRALAAIAASVRERVEAQAGAGAPGDR